MWLFAVAASVAAVNFSQHPLRKKGLTAESGRTEVSSSASWREFLCLCRMAENVGRSPVNQRASIDRRLGKSELSTIRHLKFISGGKADPAGWPPEKKSPGRHFFRINCFPTSTRTFKICNHDASPQPSIFLAAGRSAFRGAAPVKHSYPNRCSSHCLATAGPGVGYDCVAGPGVQCVAS